MKRGGWDREMHQFQTGESALDKLGNALSRADLDERRSLAQDERVSDRGSHAKDPTGTAQATLVLHLGGIDVIVSLAELQSDSIGWGDDLEVAADQGIKFFEGDCKIAMIVFWDLAPVRFEGKRAEGSGEADQVAVHIFRVTSTVLQMMAQRWKRRAESVKEPVIGHVERRRAELEAAGAQPHVARGFNLLFDGLR